MKNRGWRFPSNLTENQKEALATYYTIRENLNSRIFSCQKKFNKAMDRVSIAEDRSEVFYLMLKKLLEEKEKLDGSIRKWERA